MERSPGTHSISLDSPKQALGEYSSEISEGNFFVQAELFFNRFDRLPIISILSGIGRFFLAIGQFVFAISQKCTNNSDRENHFRHAGLNFARSIAAMIPLFGSIALASYDKSQVRWAYECETTPIGTWRKGCLETNYDNWLKEQHPKEDIVMNDAGGGAILGGAVSQFLKAAPTLV